jgi:hypothetical protein
MLRRAGEEVETMADETRRERTGDVPLGTENAEMSPNEEVVSDFGELAAKERAMQGEAGRDIESGSVAEQRAYLRREARIDDEERERRADAADIHNTPNARRSETDR